MTDKVFTIQVERNLRGIELEKADRVEEAIMLYEANVREYFIGSHPYKRLAIIYVKQKKYSDAKRILEQAVELFKNDTFRLSPNTLSKYEDFKKRLDKVNKYLKNKI